MTARALVIDALVDHLVDAHSESAACRSAARMSGWRVWSPIVTSRQGGGAGPELGRGHSVARGGSALAPDRGSAREFL